METLEAYTELSIQLATIEDKLNKLLEQNKQKEVQVKPISLPIDKVEQERLKKLFDEIVPKDVFVDDIQIPNIGYTGCARCGKWQCTGNCSSANEIRCYFESLSPEDRMKPMSISCPCKRCSAYSMSGGSVQSVGSDAWKNTITGKLQE